MTDLADLQERTEILNAAIAVLFLQQRLSELSEDDRKDYDGFFNDALKTKTSEDLQEIMNAILEVLSQRPVKLVPFTPEQFRDKPENQAPHP